MARIWLVPVVAGITIGLGGCGKTAAPGQTAGAAASAPAALRHPCDVVTVQDAERVFGPGAHLVRSETECGVEPAPAELSKRGTITLKIEPVTDSWESGKQMMMQSDETSKQVSGVGDDAFTFMRGLIAKKGKAQISAIGSGYHDDKTREDALRYLGAKLAAGI